MTEARLRPKRSSLPDLLWLMLLPVVVKDAPPGRVLEVHTAAMRDAADQAVAQAGRDDLVVVGPAPHVREVA